MMKNQLAGLMKQAQTMQDNMKKAQDELAAMEVEGVAGAGMVKIVMTGSADDGPDWQPHIRNKTRRRRPLHRSSVSRLHRCRRRSRSARHRVPRSCGRPSRSRRWC